MPAIMAQLVMRIGRSRPRAPATAASAGSAPSSRWRSAKVTSRIALATATPIAMIAPMNDWRLIVVPVSQSASDDAGHDRRASSETTTSARRTDWKLAVSRSRMTTMAMPRPIASPRRISRIGTIWPRTSTVDPAGGWPARGDRPVDLAGDPAQVLAGDVRRQADHALHVVAVVLARHRPRADRGDVAEQERLGARPLDRDRLDLGAASPWPGRGSRPAPGSRCRSWGRASSWARRTGWTRWPRRPTARPRRP